MGCLAVAMTGMCVSMHVFVSVPLHPYLQVSALPGRGTRTCLNWKGASTAIFAFKSSRFNFLAAGSHFLTFTTNGQQFGPLPNQPVPLLFMSPAAVTAGTAKPFFIRREPVVVPMERKL